MTGNRDAELAMRSNEQVLLAAQTMARGWLTSFASRIVVIAPQQKCGR